MSSLTSGTFLKGTRCCMQLAEWTPQPPSTQSLQSPMASAYHLKSVYSFVIQKPETWEALRAIIVEGCWSVNSTASSKCTPYTIISDQDTVIQFFSKRATPGATPVHTIEVELVLAPCFYSSLETLRAPEILKAGRLDNAGQPPQPQEVERNQRPNFVISSKFLN